MPKRPLQNRVRERRESAGISQIGLAERARLTRQSIGAIEAGRAIPAVDVALRIAQALGARVEEVFGDVPPGMLLAEMAPGDGEATGRVCVAELAGRWVSQALRGQDGDVSADGLMSQQGRRSSVELLRPEAELRENVFVMGCAPALAVVAERLNRQRGGGRFVWLSRSSTVALEQLAEQRVHLAGVHLVDARTGDANASDVRRIVKNRSVVLVTLGVWQVGWVTARGNPKRIRSAADVARRGVRLVVREAGSGARRRLDAELRHAGVPAAVARSAKSVASSHLDVARAVALGAADTGVATLEAARALELELIPFGTERYDLTVPIESLADARVVRFLDALTTGPVRRELQALGYDTEASGKRVGELLVE